jgi:hypothetical protein
VDVCLHSPVPRFCCGTELSSVRLYPLIMTVTNLVKLKTLLVFVVTDRLEIGLEAIHKTPFIPNVS